MAKRPRVVADDEPLTSNPFAGLLPDLGTEPGEAAAAEPMAAEPVHSSPADAGEPGRLDLGKRLVVRRQKKGQGGKVVTHVQGLPVEQLDSLVTRVKRELGCSGRIDSGVLVVGTGDHARVSAWLGKLGATRVALGN